MTEYIDKQAARPDEFCVGVSCQECPFLKDPLYGGCRVDDFIMALPPADVRPVVRGKWIIHDCGEATCQVCKTRQKNIWDYDGWQNFCGNCGADMREANNGKET